MVKREYHTFLSCIRPYGWNGEDKIYLCVIQEIWLGSVSGGLYVSASASPWPHKG